MYLHEWAEAVRSQWRRITGLLWPADESERVRAELDAELARRREALLRRQRRIERLKERRPADEERLQRLEAAYEKARLAFVRCKRRRTGLGPG
jgi:hypothetical protein